MDGQCFPVFVTNHNVLDPCIFSPNHTVLVLFACVMTATKFTMDAAGVFGHYGDSGPGSMTLCILIDGATLITLGLNGGTTSVVIITLDRYWKIVHAIHYRKYYRRWMMYVGLIVPWLNGMAGHLLIAPGTTKIIKGRCYVAASWPSSVMRQVSWPEYA